MERNFDQKTSGNNGSAGEKSNLQVLFFSEFGFEFITFFLNFSNKGLNIFKKYLPGCYSTLWCVVTELTFPVLGSNAELYD